MIGRGDVIEFLNAKTGKGVARMHSSFVLPVGSLVSIDKKTWKVERVTFAADHAGDVTEQQMRCDVYLSEVRES